MDRIIIETPVKRSGFPGRQRILSDKEYSLINQMNNILELVIMNTLQFNKLTSAEEILDKLIYVHDENSTDQEFDMDIDTVENICQLLCTKNGILIKLVKNNVNFYKLNHQNYV